MTLAFHCKTYTDRDRLQIELLTRRGVSVEEQARQLGRTPRAIYDYQRKAGIVQIRKPGPLLCSVPGCDTHTHALGLCTAHYAKRRRLLGTREHRQ